MEAIVSKIHASNTTKLSLNDRFTIIQTAPKVSTGHKSPVRRRRSQSVQIDRPKITAGSLRNRKLVDELERRHSSRRASRAGSVAAQRRAQLLANTQKRQLAASSRRLSAKERLMLRPNNKSTLRRNTAATGKALSVAARGKLVRANSHTNLATMKADMHGRQPQLRRSNSTSSLAGRLGVRASARQQQLSARGQHRMGQPRRSGQDASLMTGSRRPLIRGRTNVANVARAAPRGRSNSRQRRSNSRINLPSAGRRGVVGGGGEPMPANGRRRRASSRSNSVATTTRKRSRSVNSRLGAHGPVANGAAGPANRRNARGSGGRGRATNRSRSGTRNGGGLGTGGVIRGRIFRRRNSNAAHMMTMNGGATSIRERLGRPRSRNTANGGSVVRGRSRSRSRARQLTNNNNNFASASNNNNSQGNRGTRRGRSRGRKGRTPVKKSDPSKSKADLDNELDQYMANTNNEMDELMGRV